MVETSTNTNLIISPEAQYIETIDDLWADLSRKPTFIKDHFSNDYFINSKGNKKAEDIFKRAIKHGDVLNTNDLLFRMTKDLKKEIDYRQVAFSDLYILIIYLCILNMFI